MSDFMRHFQPASGPVIEPKLFPAATMDDQEAIMEGRQEPTVLGTPAFSSNDPATDNLRMLPLEDGTSAHQAALDAESVRNSTDYKSMSKDDLQAEADRRELSVEGTGANGNVTKADLVGALSEHDTEGMQAADFKTEIEAATTQDELDAAAEKYEASGKTYSSVESALEKRQTEIDEQ